MSREEGEERIRTKEKEQRSGGEKSPSKSSILDTADEMLTEISSNLPEFRG